MTRQVLTSVLSPIAGVILMVTILFYIGWIIEGAQRLRSLVQTVMAKL